MAHQDYVSRSRNKTKKNSPYKSKQPEPTGISLKMKLITLFTLVAIGGFGYFLWSIKDQAPVQNTEQATTSTTEKSQKSSGKKEAELPEPPKEKWAYREELENKEIEVGKYEVTNKGPYQMQCGSFKSKKQAEVLKANIAFAGLESTIRPPSGSKNTYYRVILGPYERKREAERDKHKLKNNNINYCQIWLWR